MRYSLRVALACLLVPSGLLVPTAAAQGFPVGNRDLPLANVTATGSSVLSSVVHYPALVAGRNTPLLAQAGGWPVVVFLHGLGLSASDYTDIAGALASQGIITVVQDTAIRQRDLQLDDAIACFPSLQAENQRVGAFFNGALDMSRAAICGHSMGGGNTVRTLAADVGYRTGFCFAPWDGGAGWIPAAAPLVQTPLAIVHGEGDRVLQWQRFAQAYFDSATAFQRIKIFYRLDETCDHGNVVSPGTTSAGMAVFARTSSLCVNWCKRYLEDDADALEAVLGAEPRTEPLLVELQVAVEEPDLWKLGNGQIGATTTLRTAGSPGTAALFLAAGTASIPTPYGTLLLDPGTLVTFAVGAAGATNTYSVPIPVPALPALVGLTLHFQGFAGTVNGTFQLTPLLNLQLQ
ncbi:MAG: hypothetical protein AAF628_34355 [Planctomycetota bacterium]